MSTANRAVETYRARYGTDPEVVVRSPGRLNLIGEHTDYNAGFALPIAIDRSTYVAAGAANGPIVDVSSEGFGAARVDRTAPTRAQGDWSDYLAGVLWALGPDGPGWQATITSDLPIGAAVSSSASLEMALLRVETALTDTPWDPLAAARLGARVENDWLDLGSGLLDQLSVSAARDGHALLIDFESVTWDQVPIPAEVTVVLLDTATRRKLTESRYNDRRADCERAAAALGAPSLRHASLADVEALYTTDRLAALRATHIVTENDRTLAAVNALRSSKPAEFGALMSASHVSMRDDFEISGPELDAIVESAWEAPGCFGARMTGGGFAGCCVALVETDSVEAFLTSVGPEYERRTGLEPALFPCRPSAGTHLL